MGACLVTPPSLRLVALAERELSAIGRQRHLQEKLDMGKLSPLPSGRKANSKTDAKSSRGSTGALEASPSPSPSASLRPSRTSLDNVGEREVKVAVHAQSTPSIVLLRTGCRLESAGFCFTFSEEGAYGTERRLCRWNGVEVE